MSQLIEAKDKHPPISAAKSRWVKLVKIHNHTKSVFLCAEEFDRSFRDFLQPTLELRHGLEHIIRAEAAEVGINDEADAKEPDYIEHSFDKAIGHEYRAFFDAADWFSVCIRERITNTLKRYSHDCITAVIPDYYPKLRPRIDKICKEIADIRSRKDIAKCKDLLEEVNMYHAVLDELLGIQDRIENCIPALVDWRRKNRFNSVKVWLVSTFVGGIVITIVTAWILIKLGLVKP